MALIKTETFYPVPAAIRNYVLAQSPVADTLGPPPKELRLLDAAALRADAQQTRREGQHDPAVGAAMQLKAAWAERETMLAAGVPRDDVDKGLAAVLRDVYPPRRTWIYYCDDCRDTGLLNCADGRSSYPCSHCERGRRFQPLAQTIQAERDRRGWVA